MTLHNACTWKSLCIINSMHLWLNKCFFLFCNWSLLFKNDAVGYNECVLGFECWIWLKCDSCYLICVQPNSLGPGVDPGHLVVTLAPGLDPAHIHPPSDGVAQNLGAPPLREFLHYSFIICFAKKPLSCSVMMNFSRAFCSSTAVLGTTSSKLPADTRLGEENKGHQLLMKMGTL